MDTYEKKIEAIDKAVEKMKTSLLSKHPGLKISQFTLDISPVKCRFAESFVVKPHSKKVTSLSWNDYRPAIFASASRDGSCVLYDSLNYTEISKIYLDKSHLTCCTFNKEASEQLAISSFEGNCYIFHPFSSTSHPVLTIEAHSDYISEIAFLDPSHIASASGDKLIRVWDIAKSDIKVAELSGHKEDVMCISAQNNTLLTGSCDFTVKQWDLRTGRQARTFESFLGDVNSIKFISEHSFLAGSAEGMVRLFDLRGLNALAFYKMSGKIENIDCSKSGRIFFSSGSTSDVKVWDLFHENTPLQTLPRGCRCIQLSPQGVLAGGSEDKVAIWQFIRYG